MKITNSGTGPRGVNLKGGEMHWLEPGQSHDFDEAVLGRLHPDLGGKFDEDAGSADADPFEAMTVQQLKDHAAEQKIDLGESTLKADILAKVKARKPAEG